ncbi:hypothetical protein LNQ81_11385 [Myroides sp. M-43]|uniref:hypothetical protein n=1 Tax=Myroides oncorhynchi TaxID=2893756 RepID=UPI001E625DE7|nr:hypothetical protein [Myroides oncorhynchi]MCC9043273.1 hypothetical protein [Myroides oncorhynchi]
MQNVIPYQEVSLNQLANNSAYTVDQRGGNDLIPIATVSSDSNVSSPVYPNNTFSEQASSVVTQEVVNSQSEHSAPETTQNNSVPNNVENQQPKRTSALSLSSIRNRKELASSLEKHVVNPDDLPKEPFTYNQLMDEWNYYTDRLLRGGLPLMASLMGMARPELKEARIELELPNAGSKLSFEENKYDLVNYLRKKLQNFDIELVIFVNEEIKLVKKVLDSKDKYQHFVSINPEVEVLKNMFDLEIR